MLAELTIKNFAIIEELTVSFEKGLTVLTGETGAGKSIMIDAVSLLVGEEDHPNLSVMAKKSRAGRSFSCTSRSSCICPL